MKEEVKKEVKEIKRICAWCGRELGIIKLEKPNAGFVKKGKISSRQGVIFL